MMISKKKGLITQGLIPDWLDKIFLNSVTPLINFFSTNNINPNWITALGFFLNLIASCFIYYGKFFIGFVQIQYTNFLIPKIQTEKEQPSQPIKPSGIFQLIT